MCAHRADRLWPPGHCPGHPVSCLTRGTAANVEYRLRRNPVLARAAADIHSVPQMEAIARLKHFAAAGTPVLPQGTTRSRAGGHLVHRVATALQRPHQRNPDLPEAHLRCHVVRRRNRRSPAPVVGTPRWPAKSLRLELRPPTNRSMTTSTDGQERHQAWRCRPVLAHRRQSVSAARLVRGPLVWDSAWSRAIRDRPLAVPCPSDVAGRRLALRIGGASRGRAEGVVAAHG